MGLFLLAIITLCGLCLLISLQKRAKKIKSLEQRIAALETYMIEKGDGSNEAEDFAKTFERVFAEGINGIMSYSMDNAFRRNEVNER